MRKPCQGSGRPRDCVEKKGMLAELGRYLTTQFGVTRFPKGLCSREEKFRNGFVLVISITKWNHMHIGNMTYNNEL